MSPTNIGYSKWKPSDHTFPPPPRYDSNGKKVPTWDTVEVDVREDEKNFLEKQSSWKHWISRASSWDNLEKQSSWKYWISRASSCGNVRQKSIEQKIRWKPATLRFPILGSIFAVTVALIIGLEVLSYISVGKNNGNGGGLAFASTVDDLSVAATFSYLYLPTVIAVFYSMIWSWVDLDTKRLEPWFQLSKAEGATAENSILLQYPFDFLAFVPIRAARRKHWAVVISGSTMMFITWAIVPLQSAIFSTGTVTRTTESRMATTASLLPMDRQITSLNSQFLNTAYGISWLDQKLPPYTTKEYAILPFAPVEKALEYTPSETWSSSTLAYYTNITCTPAIVRPGKIIGTHIFDDGRGCSSQDISLQGATGGRSDPTLVWYIQYFDDPHVDLALQNPNCSLEHSHNFLAIWAKSFPIANTTFTEFGNLTAQFCQPTYHMRTVTATVNASDHAVVGIEYDEMAPISSLPEEEFNITNFEYVIGTGISEKSLNGDLPDISIVEQLPRLLNYSLVTPVSNMVGYGIAASFGRTQDLSEPLFLHNSFESAHKLLFSMAVNALIVPGPSRDERVGFRLEHSGSIILVRSFAIVVEAFLALVGVLTCILWIYYQQRETNMTCDPASISDVMKLVRNSEKLFHSFNDNGTLTTELLNTKLQGHRFRLATYIEKCNGEMHLEALEGEDGQGNRTTIESYSGIDCPRQFQGVRPFELGFTTGAGIALVIAMAIGTVAFLYDRIVKSNGLARPSNNAIVLSILENLVPTAFATLIEPFWVILTRLLCILQPFEDLRNGNAKPNATVQAKYTSLPPQLVVWRAIRSGHFLLVMVCIVAISTNVLAVALSGLFNESVITTLIPVSTKAVYAPALNGNPDIRKGIALGYAINYYDHFYATLANLSGGAPYPPWADDRFYYLPFALPELPAEDGFDSATQTKGYIALTRGFGFDIDCSPLLLDGDVNSGTFVLKNDGLTIEFSVAHKLPSGRNITCVSYNAGNLAQLMLTAGSTEGKCALEVTTSMVLANATRDSQFDDGYCTSLVIVGWARLGQTAPGATDAATVANASQGRSLESAFMQCSAKFRTAMFNVSVDTGGRIVSSERTSDFDIDLKPFGGQDAVTSLIQQTNELVMPSGYRGYAWHNDTFASDWINSLLKIKLNSSDLIDPAKPLPNVTAQIPHISDLYRRLAAAMISFDTTLFLKPTTDAIMPAFIMTTQNRIFMSPIMFYISVILLGLQFITAIAFYAKRPRRFLPRMPLTIASIIAYVSASHAVQEYDDGTHNDDLSEVRYGYGRFRGVDGRTHVGIEKEPLVVLLKSKNPEVRRRRWPFRLRSSDPREPKTWI